MKIESCNPTAGRRGRPKTHHEDEAFIVGHARDGSTGRTVPGAVVTLFFDGRRFDLNLRPDEAEKLARQLQDTLTASKWSKQ